MEWMTKPRIKLVLVIADGKVGGGASHILGILKNVDKGTFDTHLICPSGHLSEEARKISKVEIYNVSFRSKFDLDSVFLLRRHLRQIQADGNPFLPMIVHAHGPRAGLFTSLSAPKVAKKVYTEHIYDENYRLSNNFNGWIQKKIMRLIAQKNDLIIAVSTSVRDFLIESHFADENKVVLIPNGIDLAGPDRPIRHRIREINNTPVIGTIGSLNLQKGQRYLIDAFKEVVQKYPLASLEIIGVGPLRKSIKDQVSSLKLERNISLLGARSDIRKYLKHWDVFVLPSISETFGISILEAMAAGVPVVASKVGGIPDIITNNKDGLLVEPGDPKGIVRAVSEILAHPVLAAKLKRNGLKRVGDFEIKSVVKKIEQLYLRQVG